MIRKGKQTSPIQIINQLYKFDENIIFHLSGSFEI